MLHNVEVTADGGLTPESIPGTKNHEPNTSMAIAYNPRRSSVQANDRWVFYLHGQKSGIIDRVVWTPQDGWGPSEPLTSKNGQPIRVGEGAKLAVVDVPAPWCPCFEGTQDFDFLLYTIDENGKLQQFRGPINQSGEKPYWAQEVVRIDDEEVQTYSHANLAVCRGGNRYVLAYIDTSGNVRKATRVGTRGQWSSISPGIQDARRRTPISIGVRFLRNFDSIFSVFYRPTGTGNTLISEKRIRFSESGVETSSLHSFGTSSQESSLNCASLIGDRSPLDKGNQICHPDIIYPFIRLFSVSNLDGRNTVFQYIEKSGKWVIPVGLVITNPQA
jgi:hypothetical protein